MCITECAFQRTGIHGPEAVIEINHVCKEARYKMRRQKKADLN